MGGIIIKNTNYSETAVFVIKEEQIKLGSKYKKNIGIIGDILFLLNLL